ncbi:MAG: hypothetical protein AAF800_11180 [Planctomycetota bacterium]
MFRLLHAVTFPKASAVAAGSLLLAGTSHAVTIESFGATTTLVDASFASPGGVYDGIGDFPTGPLSANELQIGVVNTNETRNVILSFQLPALPTGEVIDDIELDIFQPFNFGQPLGYTVDLDYLGVEAVAFRTDSTSFAAAGTTVVDDIFAPVDGPADADTTYDNFEGYFQNILTDVTSVLSADYVAGEFAKFRLTFDGDANLIASGDDNDAFQINAPGAAQPPRLRVTTIPEPATAVLITLGGLAVAGRPRGHANRS